MAKSRECSGRYGDASSLSRLSSPAAPRNPVRVRPSISNGGSFETGAANIAFWQSSLADHLDRVEMLLTEISNVSETNAAEMSERSACRCTRPCRRRSRHHASDARSRRRDDATLALLDEVRALHARSRKLSGDQADPPVEMRALAGTESALARCCSKYASSNPNLSERRTKNHEGMGDAELVHPRSSRWRPFIWQQDPQARKARPDSLDAAMAPGTGFEAHFDSKVDLRRG